MCGQKGALTHGLECVALKQSTMLWWEDGPPKIMLGTSPFSWGVENRGGSHPIHRVPVTVIVPAPMVYCNSVAVCNSERAKLVG